MPGQYQHTIHTLKNIVEQSIDAGIRCIDLFGVPLDSDKDAYGSQAWSETGVLNAAIAELRQEFGNDILIMADTCLDEFTDHGHCGVLAEDRWGNTYVDNDKTLALYQKMAVSQAAAGAHIVSPSGTVSYTHLTLPTTPYV